MQVPQKLKDRSTIWSSNSTSGYTSNRNQIIILNRYLYPHFTAALFTIDKTRKQLKRPWVNEWIKKIWYTHTHTHTHTHRGKLFSHKKEGILPVVTTCIDLEGIMLSQTEKDKYCKMSTYMWDLKTQSHRNIEQIGVSQRCGCVCGGRTG